MPPRGGSNVNSNGSTSQTKRHVWWWRHNNAKSSRSRCHFWDSDTTIQSTQGNLVEISLGSSFSNALSAKSRVTEDGMDARQVGTSPERRFPRRDSTVRHDMQQSSGGRVPTRLFPSDGATKRRDITVRLHAQHGSFHSHKHTHTDRVTPTHSHAQTQSVTLT